MFKAATAQLKAPFSENKGRRLGEALIGKLDQKPHACWLFCSAQKGVKNLLKGVNDAVDTDNLIGCTTDGEVSNEGFSSESAVLVGIVTDRIDFHLSVIENLSQDCEGAGRKLAQGLPKSTRYLQLFSDGITSNGCAILRGISSVLGEEIPVSGGTAGDDGRFVRTWQFAGRKMLTDAAVALGFSGDFQLSTGVRSGWKRTGPGQRCKGNNADSKSLWIYPAASMLHLSHRPQHAIFGRGAPRFLREPMAASCS